MSTYYPVYFSVPPDLSEYTFRQNTLGAGTANQVVQEQGNEAADLKLIKRYAKFSCSYRWGFKNFLKYHIQDSENVKTAKVKFDSLAWELSVRFRKVSGRDDVTAAIALASLSGITSGIIIRWSMYFKGEKVWHPIKGGDIKNLSNPYRDTFPVGRNLFHGKSYEDLLNKDCIIVYFKLESKYALLHGTTWIRDQDNEMLNAELCQTNLSCDLLNLMKNCDMSDVILNVGDSRFKAHKVILSARSERFSYMFKHAMKYQRSITILDVEAIDMYNLLVYIYSGILPDFPVDRLMNLYSAAYKYEVWAMKNRCRELIILGLNRDNIGKVQDFAMNYRDQELQTAVNSFFTFLMSNQFAMLGMTN